MTDTPEPAPDTREERLARNEVLFRSVNEAIERQASEFGGLERYDFICECSTSDCFDRIPLTLAEYEHVRGDGARFLLRPGHQNAEIEVVIEERPGFVVVEKTGVAGAIAEVADPRT